MDLKSLNSIYFLGIGGIGMSAIARYFNNKGVEVSGYDRASTQLTNELISEGIQIHFDEDIRKIPHNIDLVIYTPAIPKDNQELQYVIKKEYPIKKRSEILGLITQNNRTIAIAGTHGKTTISSIIAHILQTSGKQVTAFIGGIMKNYNSNLLTCKNPELFVVEADEYDRSFLTINPDIAVITAIDADHLDVYKTKDNLIESFNAFIKNIKYDGYLILHESIDNEKFDNSKSKILYGTNSTSDAFIQTESVTYDQINFNIISKNNLNLLKIAWNIPGTYNLENALAASLVCHLLGIGNSDIRKSLESYTGVKRRFDIQLNNPDVIYIDDYAHHPEEIKACISGIREYFPGKSICGVFQPHLYSRTKNLAKEFAESLELLDDIILLDIYPAREKPIPGVSSEIIFNKIDKYHKTLCRKEDVFKTIQQKEFDILVTLGAGDIDQLVKPIKEELLKRYA